MSFTSSCKKWLFADRNHKQSLILNLIDDLIIKLNNILDDDIYQPTSKHIATAILEHSGWDTFYHKLLTNINNKPGLNICQDKMNRYELFNYNNTFKTEKWNEFDILCRGMVIDRNKHQIKALPFPKFFNFHELDTEIQASLLNNNVFACYEKMDGAYGIVFYCEYSNKWLVITRGSFNSKQSEWATSYLNNQCDINAINKYFDRNSTYLFEIINTSQKLKVGVLNYDFTGLILLSAYNNNNGKEYKYNYLNNICNKINGLLMVKKYNKFINIAQIINECEHKLDSKKEGFVVVFENGFRIKLKSKQYLFLNKRINRNNIIKQIIEFGFNNNKIKNEFDNDHHAIIDDIYNKIYNKILVNITNMIIVILLKQLFPLNNNQKKVKIDKKYKLCLSEAIKIWNEDYIKNIMNINDVKIKIIDKKGKQEVIDKFVTYLLNIQKWRVCVYRSKIGIKYIKNKKFESLKRYNYPFIVNALSVNDLRNILLIIEAEFINFIQFIHKNGNKFTLKFVACKNNVIRKLIYQSCIRFGLTHNTYNDTNSLDGKYIVVKYLYTNNDIIHKKYQYKSLIPVLSIKHLLPYSYQEKVNKSFSNLDSFKNNSDQKIDSEYICMYEWNEIFNSHNNNNELNEMKHDINAKTIGFKNFCILLHCNECDITYLSKQLNYYPLTDFFIAIATHNAYIVILKKVNDKNKLLNIIKDKNHKMKLKLKTFQELSYELMVSIGFGTEMIDLRQQFLTLYNCCVSIILDSELFEQSIKNQNKWKDWLDFYELYINEFECSLNVLEYTQNLINQKIYKHLMNKIMNLALNKNKNNINCNENHTLKIVLWNKISQLIKQNKLYKTTKVSWNDNNFNKMKCIFYKNSLKYNNCFLYSIDQIKANFQGLKWLNPNIFDNLNDWQLFMRQFTKYECIIKSKKIRSIIFQKVIPFVWQRIQQFITMELINYLQKDNRININIIGQTDDEIVLKLNDNVEIRKEELKKINKIIKNFELKYNYKFKTKCFKLKSIEPKKKWFVQEIIDCDGNVINKELSCVDKAYYNLCHDLVFGLEKDERNEYYFDMKTLQLTKLKTNLKFQS